VPPPVDCEKQKRQNFKIFVREREKRKRPKAIMPKAMIKAR
jgi:hypothetical protein